MKNKLTLKFYCAPLKLKENVYARGLKLLQDFPGAGNELKNLDAAASSKVSVPAVLLFFLLSHKSLVIYSA